MLESLMIWIQLFLVVVMITYVGTSLRDTLYAVESVHATHFDEFSYYQGRNSIMSGIFDAQTDGLSPEGIRQHVTEEEKQTQLLEQSILRVYSARTTDRSIPLNPYIEGQLAQITVVEPALTDRTILPLSEGRWFQSDWDEIQGYQAIVSTDLAEHFHLGETYTINIATGFFGEDETEISIHIVGVLSRENYMYPENIPLTDHFLQRGYFGLLLRVEEPETIASQNIAIDCGYIYGEIHADEALYRIAPMTEELETFMDHMYPSIALLSLLAGVIGALALFGAGCSVVLRTSADIKRYAIMSFSGASWRDCVLIELWKILILYFTSMVAVSIWIWGIQPFVDINYYQRPSSPEFFCIGVAIAFALYIPVSLWKVWHVARQNPIEVIKED